MNPTPVEKTARDQQYTCPWKHITKAKQGKHMNV